MRPAVEVTLDGGEPDAAVVSLASDALSCVAGGERGREVREQACSLAAQFGLVALERKDVAHAQLVVDEVGVGQAGHTCIGGHEAEQLAAAVGRDDLPQSGLKGAHLVGFPRHR